MAVISFQAIQAKKAIYIEKSQIPVKDIMNTIVVVLLCMTNRFDT